MSLNTYQSLKDELYQGRGPESFRFTKMAGPNLKTSFVKIPRVKEVAIKYSRDLSLDLGDFSLNESVELTLAYFIIGLLRQESYEGQIGFLLARLSFGGSWMITDSSVQFVKKIPYADFIDTIYPLFARDPAEYARRFGYILALRYYREKNIGSLLEGIRFEDSYYVSMAESWLLATLAISHATEVLTFIQGKDVPLFVKRKTISKIQDSFRISDEDKKKAKGLRAHF